MPWEEDSYGILKRWVVFRDWVDTYAKRRGLSRLSMLDYGGGTGALVTDPLALLGHTSSAASIVMSPPSRKPVGAFACRICRFAWPTSTCWFAKGPSSTWHEPLSFLRQMSRLVEKKGGSHHHDSERVREHSSGCPRSSGHWTESDSMMSFTRHTGRFGVVLRSGRSGLARRLIRRSPWAFSTWIQSTCNFLRWRNSSPSFQTAGFASRNSKLGRSSAGPI